MDNFYVGMDIAKTYISIGLYKYWLIFVWYCIDKQYRVNPEILYSTVQVYSIGSIIASLYRFFQAHSLRLSCTVMVRLWITTILPLVCIDIQCGQPVDNLYPTKLLRYYLRGGGGGLCV